MARMDEEERVDVEDTEPVVQAAREVLLDALEALGALRDAVILVGAQAVYARTGPSGLAVAEYTRDADLAIDTERIPGEPQIDVVLENAGFSRGDQPGTWTSARYTGEGDPIPVDFLVAEAMSGRPGKRAAIVPGQPENSARQVRGLEGVLVDHDLSTISSLTTSQRSFRIRVAGPAALIVAKVHKIAERVDTSRRRDKDALDVYRLLRVFESDELRVRFNALERYEVSAEPTAVALDAFASLFGSTRAPGTDMVVRATAGLEPEDEVRRSTATLAQDLLKSVGRST